MAYFWLIFLFLLQSHAEGDIFSAQFACRDSMRSANLPLMEQDIFPSEYLILPRSEHSLYIFTRRGVYNVDLQGVEPFGYSGFSQTYPLSIQLPGHNERIFLRYRVNRRGGRFDRRYYRNSTSHLTLNPQWNDGEVPHQITATEQLVDSSQLPLNQYISEQLEGTLTAMQPPNRHRINPDSLSSCRDIGSFPINAQLDRMGEYWSQDSLPVIHRDGSTFELINFNGVTFSQ